MKTLKKYLFLSILFAVIGINLLTLIPKETKAAESTMCAKWYDVCYLMDERLPWYKGN